MLLQAHQEVSEDTSNALVLASQWGILEGSSPQFFRYEGPAANLPHIAYWTLSHLWFTLDTNEMTIETTENWTIPWGREHRLMVTEKE